MNTLASVDPHKAAAYIRWSTDEQGEGTTLVVQRDACHHYILAQGWEYREDFVFVDEGYSGGTLDRPGLSALRAAIRRGEIHCVVVFKLDRLSRSVIDTVQLVLREWGGACFLKSTREPVDTTTATGKIFFYMLASYAEWERSIIRERTLTGKARRAQEGKNPGMALPYGYIIGSARGEIVVHEAQAAVVRGIFHDYLHGVGPYQLVQRLNAKGIPAQRGGRWAKRSVENILRNAAYTGILAYGKSARTTPELRRRLGKAVVYFDQPRHALVENGFPVIISRSDFDRVQKIREQRGNMNGKRALASTYLLTGIATCRCGATLMATTATSPRGRYRYYRCATRASGRVDECTGGGLPAELVEEKIVAALRAEVSLRNRDALLNRYRGEWQGRLIELEAAVSHIQEARAGLGARRRKLDHDYDTDRLPSWLYAERVADLKNEYEQLQTRSAMLEVELEQCRTTRPDLLALSEESAKVDAWEHLTPDQRKQVLRYLVERLVIYRSQLGRGWRNKHAPIEIELAVRQLGEPRARFAVP